jgi:hypothetical protein
VMRSAARNPRLGAIDARSTILRAVGRMGQE